MKIVSVIEYFRPEIWWLEKSTERLSQQLAKYWNEVKIVTKKIDNTLSKEIKDNIEIERYEDTPDAPFTKNAEKNNAFYNADIICVFGVWHDKEAKRLKPIFDSKAWKYIKIWTQWDIVAEKINYDLYKCFNWILCQNDALINEAISIWVPKEKCFRIKNWIDISAWKKDLKDKKYYRNTLQIPEDTFVFSVIWRLVKRKNVPLIINAFLEHTKSNNKFWNNKLIIQWSDFGQHDWEEIKIKELIKEQEKNIIFLDANDNVYAALWASDVFITMWEREWAPNIIIEALASRKPCIVSDIPWHTVYIQDEENWFLSKIEKNNLKNIMDNFSLLPTHEYKKMTNKAEKKSHEFDIKDTAKIYLEIFKKFIW